jgi:hypothetical protein
MFYNVAKGSTMKTKLITMLLIMPMFAFSELNIEKVGEALSSLESTKELKFYNRDRALLNKFNHTQSDLKFTSIDQADILLFPKFKTEKKPIIVDSYQALKENRKNTIGAIYSKKGRTQIFFVEERLQAKGLKLSPNMRKYLISECYLNSFCLLK